MDWKKEIKLGDIVGRKPGKNAVVDATPEEPVTEAPEAVADSGNGVSTEVVAAGAGTVEASTEPVASATEVAVAEPVAEQTVTEGVADPVDAVAVEAVAEAPRARAGAQVDLEA